MAKHRYRIVRADGGCVKERLTYSENAGWFVSASHPCGESPFPDSWFPRLSNGSKPTIGIFDKGNNPNMERVAYVKPTYQDIVDATDGKEPFSVVDAENTPDYSEPTLEPTFFEKYGLWVVVIGGGLIAYFVMKK
jgi:hypothetical protein